MGTKRKYAYSKAITKNPISFEMVEEKVKAMQPGKKKYGCHVTKHRITKIRIGL